MADTPSSSESKSLLSLCPISGLPQLTVEKVRGEVSGGQVSASPKPALQGLSDLTPVWCPAGMYLMGTSFKWW